MPRLGKRIRRLRQRCYVDVGDYRQTVFLAGTGRSGTTWVEEIINHNNDYRVMFEPFHSLELALLRDWNYKQYLRSDNDEEKYLAPATAILDGRIRHPWIDKFNRKVVARKRIIKDIRANLILKWIKRHFPEIPIILLIRHPCAVANSRIKLKWNCHLDAFLEQDELISDYLHPFKREIESATDLFEKHLFMWCVENYIPLRQFSPGDILVVFYEDLCATPDEEIARLMAFLENHASPATAREVLTKPSALCRDESAVLTGSSLLDSWRKDLSREQQARAGEICRLFGLDAIYGDGNLPRVSGEDVLNLL